MGTRLDNMQTAGSKKGRPSGTPGYRTSDRQAQSKAPRLNSAPHQLPTRASPGDDRTMEELDIPSQQGQEAGTGEARARPAVPGGLGSSCADFRTPGRRSACDS